MKNTRTQVKRVGNGLQLLGSLLITGTALVGVIRQLVQNEPEFDPNQNN